MSSATGGGVGGMAGNVSAGGGGEASLPIGKDGATGLLLTFGELICGGPRSAGAGEDPGLRTFVSQEWSAQLTRGRASYRTT
jgi:hypothetical protein